MYDMVLTSKILVDSIYQYKVEEEEIENVFSEATFTIGLKIFKTLVSSHFFAGR